MYVLLEYASNGCLFFYIHSNKGLPEHLALRFLYQTAKAVKYLHENNFIHRDIKPENILFDKDFNVKLCDFGWSCELRDKQKKKSVCGTYEYMSPEIVAQVPHDYGVDIWCLGILLYEMLHGKTPYKATNMKEIQNEIFKKKILINSALTKETKDLLKKILKPNPKKRINIDELLNH